MIKRIVLDVYRKGEDQPVVETELDQFDETGNPETFFADVMIDDKPYRIFVDLKPPEA